MYVSWTYYTFLLTLWITKHIWHKNILQIKILSWTINQSKLLFQDEMESLTDWITAAQNPCNTTFLESLQVNLKQFKLFVYLFILFTILDLTTTLTKTQVSNNIRYIITQLPSLFTSLLQWKPPNVSSIIKLITLTNW